MTEQYSRHILRVALAQMCQSMGWNAVQSTPMELLTDVLERYMLQLGKYTHRYCEQCEFVCIHTVSSEQGVQILSAVLLYVQVLL